MKSITFIQPNGQERTLVVGADGSVMHIAIMEGIEGIVGECGGSAMCATCHVYVKADQTSLLPKMSAVEDTMLDSTVCERKSESRLSCQLRTGDVPDGLVLYIPETQI